MTADELERLLGENKLQVHSVAYSYLKDKGDTDMVVQDTFIHAFYHSDTLKDATKLTSWLCGIARNKALKLNASVAPTVPLDILDGVLQEETPENAVISKDDRDMLSMAINTLSEPLREPIIMFYLADMPLKRISDILGIPVGTVKRRLHDARKKLGSEMRVHMGEQVREDGTKTNSIIKKVESYLSMIRKESSEMNMKKASELCDEALTHLAGIDPTDNGTKMLLVNLYGEKAHAIRFAEGTEACLEYIKKQTLLLEDMGKPKYWPSNT